MPVRILIVGCLPDANGIASYVMNLYRNIDRDRFQYDFLIREDYRNRGDKVKKEICRLGGRIFYLNYEWDHFPSESLNEFDLFLGAHPEIRGMHVHGVVELAASLAVAEKYGLPIKIIHCHWACPRSTAAMPVLDEAKLSAIRMIKGEQFTRLACSDLSGRFGFQGLPFEVAKNAVDLDRFVFSPAYRALIRAQMGIDEKTPVLGFVTNIFGMKNPVFALRVFSAFHAIRPDSHFLMVGYGHGYRPIKDFIRDCSFREKIHFMKTPASTDMLYSAMDLILCTSFHEGMPFSLIEAQSTGLPCLVSDEVSEMIRITPLVQMVSLREGPETWAELALSRIEGGEERRSQKEEMTKAGYDIRSAVEEMMKTYQRLLQEQESFRRKTE